MIEQLLRAYAEAGKFSHLSVYAQWGAHNSPTVFHATFMTPWGQGHGSNTDPIAAMIEAVDKAPKAAQRQTPVVRTKVDDVQATAARDVGLTPTNSEPLAPAPVARQPNKVARPSQTVRKTPQGQDVSIPNLMDLFK